MSQSSWTYFKTQLQIPQGSSEVENRGRPINDRKLFLQITVIFPDSGSSHKD